MRNRLRIARFALRGADAEIWFQRSEEGAIVGLRYQLFGQSGTAKRR